MHYIPNISWLDTFIYLNIFLVLSVVFFEHKNAAATWAWIMVMLFVPIAGFVLYLLIGQDLRKRKTFSKKEEEDSFSALLHNQKADLAHHLDTYANPLILPYRDLIALHLVAHESLYTEDNSVQIFTDGRDLFKSLFKALKQAKQFIHIEYYIFRDDKLGQILKKILLQKAKEGVNVSIVYDDMGCFGNHPSFFNDMRKAGININCFFPSYIPFLKRRANYRNHRKIIVIDNEVAYLGGFNIGVEYLGLTKKFGYWRDTHLLLQGSSVRLINLQFLLDERFASHEDRVLSSELATAAKSPHSGSSQHVGIQIVSSGPDSKYANIYNGFITMIHAAKSSILIQTPYFIPDEGIMTALKLAALSGKEVRIMIPNKPDHLFVYWATYCHIGELLDSGVQCFLYTNGFLHAKTIVIDNEICSVGTANFDMRSFKLNFEINAFIYDRHIASKLSATFAHDLVYCKPLTYEHYQQRSLWIKIKESLSRLISPIL